MRNENIKKAITMMLLTVYLTRKSSLTELSPVEWMKVSKSVAAEAIRAQEKFTNWT